MFLACDTETTGLDFFHGARAFAVGIMDERGKSGYWDWPVNDFPYVGYDDRSIEIIAAKLDNASGIVFHNAKFDIQALRAAGVWTSDSDIPWDKIHDTVLMAHVLDSSEEHGLKALALRYLNIDDDDESELREAVIKARRKIKDQGVKDADIHWGYWLPKHLDPKNKLCQTYCVRDCERTIRLFKLFQVGLKNEKLTAMYERERCLLRHVYSMQQHGIPLRPLKFRESRLEFQKAEANHASVIIKSAKQHGLSDFNIDSPNDLRTLLYDKLGFNCYVTTAKDSAPSTSKEAIQAIWTNDLGGYVTERGGLERPAKKLCKRDNERAIVLERLVQRSQMNTACRYLSNYEDYAVPDNMARILHPQINQVGTGEGGTKTTRFSMSNPNGQNVSTRSEIPLRRLFGPRAGHFWYDIDYSNIELRLFAWLSGEDELIRAFEQGASIHKIVCERLHGITLTGDYKKDPRYKRTKNGNFSVIYGAGEYHADATYGVTGAYAKFRQMFRKADQFMDDCIRQARKVGYVTTAFGYRLYTPPARPYAALNYKIQGSAGDVMKYGMINVGKELNPASARMILTVHDELLVDITLNPKRQETVTHHHQHTLPRIIRAMEEPGKRVGIPCPVEPAFVTNNWAEQKFIPPRFLKGISC